MGRETYFPQLAILVPERQSCACLRGQYTLRKIITRHSDHVPRLNLHAPAAPPVPHFPRFRALALFGRRPPQRVDSLVMPASENLHMSRHRAAANSALIRSLHRPWASRAAGAASFVNYGRLLRCHYPDAAHLTRLNEFNKSNVGLMKCIVSHRRPSLSSFFT